VNTQQFIPFPQTKINLPIQRWPVVTAHHSHIVDQANVGNGWPECTLRLVWLMVAPEFLWLTTQNQGETMVVICSLPWFFLGTSVVAKSQIS
jgi:hypothetical protein